MWEELLLAGARSWSFQWWMSLECFRELTGDSVILLIWWNGFDDIPSWCCTKLLSSMCVISSSFLRLRPSESSDFLLYSRKSPVTSQPLLACFQELPVTTSFSLKGQNHRKLGVLVESTVPIIHHSQKGGCHWQMHQRNANYTPSRWRV